MYLVFYIISYGQYESICTLRRKLGKAKQNLTDSFEQIVYHNPNPISHAKNYHAKKVGYLIKARDTTHNMTKKEFQIFNFFSL